MGLDVSGSVDTREYQLQIHGLAAALTSRDVTSSILSMPKAPVKLLVFEWNGQNYQRILVPWIAAPRHGVQKARLQRHERVAIYRSVSPRPSVYPPGNAHGAYNPCPPIFLDYS